MIIVTGDAIKSIKIKLKVKDKKRKGKTGKKTIAGRSSER